MKLYNEIAIRISYLPLSTQTVGRSLSLETVPMLVPAGCEGGVKVWPDQALISVVDFSQFPTKVGGKGFSECVCVYYSV